MNGKVPQHQAAEIVMTVVGGKVTSTRVLRSDEFVASFGRMVWLLEKAGYSVKPPPDERHGCDEQTGVQSNAYA
ncbi:TPA: hypothetical protein IRQ32_004139 [Escherichia coli]|nr:hypothetical protein [Escherichia coli]